MMSFRATFCTAVNEKPICGVLAVKHGAARRNRHKKVPSLFLGRIYDSFGMERDDLLQESEIYAA